LRKEKKNISPWRNAAGMIMVKETIGETRDPLPRIRIKATEVALPVKLTGLLLPNARTVPPGITIVRILNLT
jgi:hypothetical protein